MEGAIKSWKISNWDEVLAQAEIIEISKNIAHNGDNQSGPSSSWWNGLYMPSFLVPQNNPLSTSMHASQSVMFEARHHRNRDLRHSSSVPQTLASGRTTWSQWTQSSQHTPRRGGFVNRASRATNFPQVKSEPQSTPSVPPPVLSKKKEAELVGKECHLLVVLS